MGVCGISHRFQWLSHTPGQIPTRYSPVRRCPPPEGGFSLDLHVLGLPPAFVLSQDQTLTLLTPARLKQTDKHKSRPSILKHLQNTRNNFNAPNRHTNADRASLPTSNNSLCQKTQQPETGCNSDLSLLERSRAYIAVTGQIYNDECRMLQRQNLQ